MELLCILKHIQSWYQIITSIEKSNVIIFFNLENCIALNIVESNSELGIHITNELWQVFNSFNYLCSLLQRIEL
jgi:hypothetical protein